MPGVRGARRDTDAACASPAGDAGEISLRDLGSSSAFASGEGAWSKRGAIPAVLEVY